MIYIIRHGLTELNKRHVLQGRSDHPLNAQGIAQAKEAASGLLGEGHHL
jgi:broad specificity phosphatase PhoE